LRRKNPASINDAKWSRSVVIVLADLMRSGEKQKIYDKWFSPGLTDINMPIGPTLKTAFEIQALPY